MVEVYESRVSSGAHPVLRARRKHCVLAYQMTEARRQAEWPTWLQDKWRDSNGTDDTIYAADPLVDDGELIIHCCAGEHHVSWDDWIVLGPDGQLRQPLGNAAFAASYQLCRGSQE